MFNNYNVKFTDRITTLGWWDSRIKMNESELKKILKIKELYINLPLMFEVGKGGGITKFYDLSNLAFENKFCSTKVITVEDFDLLQKNIKDFVTANMGKKELWFGLLNNEYINSPTPVFYGYQFICEALC